MPVYFESAEQPSTQDLADLEKIYADAPAWLLPPYANGNALLEQGLAQKTLVAGRFNSRLLGAALLEKQTDRWLLSHLCVRELTRNRGVARRIVQEASRLAAEAGAALEVVIPEGQQHLCDLAREKSLIIAKTV
ncbi:acetyl-CoA sensor PanZ family protein [Denitrificimonas sp. JX-1]|uniref:Acetyl-CoA sensor PanZ family protein n=1 Tax=Denitrificimonas halotolerans TaxID=3098930 RepID=A0ABU5GTA8_9GAMM|nr:acetyl-CoA sensor PanZ family protein [Denitrificimonas sp. JX-1]MDY7220209.1 acetyl-CoA sensor PanZ family protein [Denitrificimonas sp. JX-1]